MKYINNNKKYFEKKICYGKISSAFNKVQPLIFENINNKNFLYKEELFLPILIIEEFKDIREALKKSNISEYGLSGSLWAKKNPQNEKVLSKIDSGRLWLNGSIYQNYPFLQVGGLKSSGNGRVAGIESINNYCINKTLIINKN